MPSEALAFYSQHSVITDPGSETSHFADLPRDLPSLHQITQNILIHNWKVRKYNPEWLERRTDEYELRTVEQMLAHAFQHDAAPITVTRPKEQRLIVDCRHFAVLLCSLLRAQGVPARVRCGFATYLEETHYQDHWVCEYWNGERWLLEDPDLVKHDLLAAEFFTGGRAWQLARSGEMPAEQFGYDPDWRGLWVIRHDVIRDLASLNGFETLSSDNWGLIETDEQDVTKADRALLDRAAALTLVDQAGFGEMRAFYASQPAFRIAGTITCYNYVAGDEVPHAVGVSALHNRAV